MCVSCASAAARGDRLVAHRAVRARHHHASASPACSANYDFVSRETLAYFNARLTRRRATPTSRSTTSSATRARREQQQAVLAAPDVQVRRAVGAARRPPSRLCRARAIAARRLRAGAERRARDGRRSTGARVPRLPRGVRLQLDEARERWIAARAGAGLRCSTRSRSRCFSAATGTRPSPPSSTSSPRASMRRAAIDARRLAMLRDLAEQEDDRAL